MNLYLKYICVAIFFFNWSHQGLSQKYLEWIEAGDKRVSEIQAEAESYFQHRDKGKGSGYKDYKRWEYNAVRMMDQNGYLSSNEDHIQELGKLNKSLNQYYLSGNRSAAYWSELGPSSYLATSSWNPGVGRITSFDIDTNDPEHVIIGAETGGVWKKSSDDIAWQPLMDYFSNISVQSVAIDDKNPNVYYFGSTGGRIYTSLDAGKTWNQLTNVGSSSVRKILIHPNNPDIMFVCVQNSGFFRTDNRGFSWTKITEDSRAYDIAFKPNDVSTVYATGLALHISKDGGNTFTTKNQGIGNAQLIKIPFPNNTEKYIDAVENTFNLGRVKVPVYPEKLIGNLALFKDEDGTSFACSDAANGFELQDKIVLIKRGNCTFASKVYRAQLLGAVAVIMINDNPNEAFAMGGEGNANITIPAIMVSGNDGNYLIDLITNQGEWSIELQQQLFPSNSFGIGAKLLGLSPSAPNQIYVLEADGNKFGGIYKSIDGGENFTKLFHENVNYFGYDTQGLDEAGQAPRCMAIAVHPNDANEVHIGGILSWMSTDGGISFTCTSDWIPNSAEALNIGYCHADITKMEFYKNDLVVTSDGGIFKAKNTKNVGFDYYEDETFGLGIRQFYKIGVSQTKPVIVTGGSQDNGTSTYMPATGWTDWLGADGMETFVDKNDPNILYGTTQFGSLYRSESPGNYESLIVDANVSGNWVTPFEQDPVAPNTLYVGYQFIYKSEDKGQNWTKFFFPFPAPLNHLKIAPSNNQIIFVAQASSLYKSNDGGQTWREINTWNFGNINSIAIHPKDPNKIAIASTSEQRVLVSFDGGESWNSYQKNLPSFSALAVVWQNNNLDGLYVGMNFGVFYIDKNQQNWLPFINNLPNVIINELEINEAENKIYAATYGRGLWASDLYIVSSTEPQDEVLGVKIFPNPAMDVLLITIPKDIQAETDIEIYDASGKQVVNEKDHLNDFSLDIHHLVPGPYYVRISNKSGTCAHKLIVY